MKPTFWAMATVFPLAGCIPVVPVPFIYPSVSCTPAVNVAVEKDEIRVFRSGLILKKVHPGFQWEKILYKWLLEEGKEP